MTPPDQNPEPEIKCDDPLVAAEWALGLLEGEELLAARGKYATDPDFAWRKQWWDNWFAPLTDAMSGAEPDADVWNAIAARIATQQAPATHSGQSSPPPINVIALETSVRRWKWVAGLTSVAAATALALLAFAPGNTPIDVVGGTAAPMRNPLVATVPIGDTGLRLDVTYIPESERMLVAAIGLTADGVHDHELWLVPSGGGALKSLGVVVPGAVHSTLLPADITASLNDGARLLLTREPLGGKPEGRDAGPVVASGAFTRV